MTQDRRSSNLALALGDDPLARLVSLGPAPLALWELIELVLGSRAATGLTGAHPCRFARSPPIRKSAK